MRTDDQYGNTKGMGQRGQRADGVAEPGVLHHCDAARAADPGARCRGHRIPLVGGGQIVQFRVPDNGVDERCQKRARHPGVPGEPPIACGIDEIARVDHDCFERFRLENFTLHEAENNGENCMRWLLSALARSKRGRAFEIGERIYVDPVSMDIDYADLVALFDNVIEQVLHAHSIEIG